MKRTLLFAAIAALAFTSCAKDEVLNQSSSNAIGFDTFIGKNTKGTPQETFNPNDAMRVHGYITDAQMGADMTGATSIINLGGTKVTKGADGTWAYTPEAYWVDGKFHSFFAVYPYAQISDVTTDGSVNIDVEDDIENQVDLMVADPIKLAAKYTAGETVAQQQFKFRHVLSQIMFKAKIAVPADAYAKDIKITGITLKQTTGAFENSGVISIVKKTGTGDYTYETGATSTTVANYTITPTTPVALNTTDSKAINHKDTHIAMLLPQTVDPLTMTVSVSYTDLSTGTEVQKTATFDVETTNTFTWAPNKRYTYNINIDVMQQILKMTKIEFGEPSADSWTDGTGNE